MKHEEVLQFISITDISNKGQGCSPQNVVEMAKPA